MSDLTKYILIVFGTTIGAFMGLCLAALWLEPFLISVWLCAAISTLSIIFGARAYKRGRIL